MGFAMAVDLTVEAARDMESVLAPLPKGAWVAIVSMGGSLCPITLGHAQCFIEARALLLGLEPSAWRPPNLENFSECLGFVDLNSDSHVGQKVKLKGQRSLNERDRAHLVRVATQDLPWLCYRGRAHLYRGHRQHASSGFTLQSAFPHLKFVEFKMNGADDVAKYRKWQGAGPRYRMITMGRPGFTEVVLKGAASAKVAPEHFLIGPELPDISSTEARTASMRNDATTLVKLLHPGVADFLLQRDGHEGLQQTLTAAGSTATDLEDENGIRLEI